MLYLQVLTPSLISSSSDCFHICMHWFSGHGRLTLDPTCTVVSYLTLSHPPILYHTYIPYVLCCLPSCLLDPLLPTFTPTLLLPITMADTEQCWVVSSSVVRSGIYCINLGSDGFSWSEVRALRTSGYYGVRVVSSFRPSETVKTLHTLPVFCNTHHRLPQCTVARAVRVDPQRSVL